MAIELLNMDNEQERARLMAEKSDDDLIKYALNHCTCVEGRPLIRELAWRYKKILMKRKVIRL